MTEKISHWAWVGMKYRPALEKETERLAESLCMACGYTLEQVAERTRKREIVNVRQQVIYVIKKRHKVSHNIIGKLFGNIDHTTVTHGLKSAKNHIETEPDYKKRVDMLLEW